MKRLIPLLALWLIGCESVSSVGGVLPPLDAVGASTSGPDATATKAPSRDGDAARPDDAPPTAPASEPDDDALTDVASVFDAGSIPVDPPSDDEPDAAPDDDVTSREDATPPRRDDAAESEARWLARPYEEDREPSAAQGTRPAWTADDPVAGWGVRLLSVIPDSQPPRAVLGLPDGREVVVSPGAMLPEAQVVVLAIGRDAVQIAEVLPDGDRAVVRSQMLSPLYGARRESSR